LIPPTSILSDIYGTRTKYQIKSVISIVNQVEPLHIVGGKFENNVGTKGIIYIDMKHSSTKERLFIAGVTFNKNMGYIDSSVVFIRGRAPSGVDIYTNVPLSTDSYCAGYSIQSNIFTNNFGC
jgi:hypothetical protein